MPQKRDQYKIGVKNTNQDKSTPIRNQIETKPEKVSKTKEKLISFGNADTAKEYKGVK